MADGLAAGEVIVYPYRWVEERDADRSQDGVKDRPCCVVVTATTSSGAILIFLAPVSSKPPRVGQTALPIPALERKRAGLERYPDAWIYVDEVNTDRPATSWYLEPQTPLGAFSKSFLAKISSEIRMHVRADRIVARRP